MALRADSQPEVSIVDAIRISGLLSAVIVLLITVIAVRLISSAVARLGNRFVDKRLLINQVGTLFRFVAYIVGLSIAIAFSVNLSREAVLALSGTAAVTIGFALKDLAASVLAGIIIIFDRPFQVGDRVSFGGSYGEISAIGLRSVRLVTLDDNVVTIPNSKFLTEAVSSGNWGALDMMIQLDFFIGVDQDVSLAKKLVKEALITNRYIYQRKPWLVMVNQVIEKDYLAVRLRAQGYVLDVKYEKQFHTEVTERVLELFRSHHVRPPAVLHRNIA